MNLLQASQRLKELDLPYFRSNEAAGYLDLDTRQAAVVLRRLSRTGHLIKLARGRWALPERFERWMLPQALVAPQPAYVSLYTALAHHGLIEQIPEVVYGVTVARTQRVETPVGTASLHQVAPAWCHGFELYRDGIYLAAPEKALADVLYLTPARSGLFRALPEVELPASFSQKRLRSFLRQIPTASRRTLAERRWERMRPERRIT